MTLVCIGWVPGPPPRIVMAERHVPRGNTALVKHDVAVRSACVAAKGPILGGRVGERWYDRADDEQKT